MQEDTEPQRTIEDYLSGRVPFVEITDPSGDVLKLYLKETDAGIVFSREPAPTDDEH